MPTIVKQSVPHILISMFVAPIILSLFAWAGSSILGNREIKVLMPTVTKQLNDISHKLDKQDEKQTQLMKLVYKNKEDVAVIKAIIKGDK